MNTIAVQRLRGGLTSLSVRTDDSTRLPPHAYLFSVETQGYEGKHNGRDSNTIYKPSDYLLATLDWGVGSGCLLDYPSLPVQLRESESRLTRLKTASRYTGFGTRLS